MPKSPWKDITQALPADGQRCYVYRIGSPNPVILTWNDGDQNFYTETSPPDNLVAQVDTLKWFSVRKWKPYP